jgi:hypothetical protein
VPSGNLEWISDDISSSVNTESNPKVGSAATPIVGLKETVNSEDDKSSHLIFLAKSGKIVIGAFLCNQPLTLPDGRTRKCTLCHRLTGCFWPNPADRASIAGCQVENPEVALTGRYRPIADIRAAMSISRDDACLRRRVGTFVCPARDCHVAQLFSDGIHAEAFPFFGVVKDAP